MIARLALEMTLTEARIQMLIAFLVITSTDRRSELFVPTATASAIESSGGGMHGDPCEAKRLNEAQPVSLVAQEPDYNKGTLFGAGYFKREPRTKKGEEGTTGPPSRAV